MSLAHRSSMCVSLAALLAACGSPTESSPSASPHPAAAGAEPSADTCRAELDAIAHCLRMVVSLTHDEPPSMDAMASFLGHATWTIAAYDVHQACEPLGLRAGDDSLRLSDGSLVRASRTEDFDEFDDGRTVVNIHYRFASDGCPETAETTLQLSMGGSR